MSHRMKHCRELGVGEQESKAVVDSLKFTTIACQVVCDKDAVLWPESLALRAQGPSLTLIGCVELWPLSGGEGAKQRRKSQKAEFE